MRLAAFWRSALGILVRLGRGFVFAWACVSYARRRAKRFESQLPAGRWSFVVLALRQYGKDGVGLIPLGRVVLRSTFTPERVEASKLPLGAGPQAFAQLLLAEGLKAGGFFSDAAAVYRQLIYHPKSEMLARLGLSDLIRLQAAWAREYEVYAARSLVTDPLVLRSGGEMKLAWRSFEDGGTEGGSKNKPITAQTELPGPSAPDRKSVV